MEACDWSGKDEAIQCSLSHLNCRWLLSLQCLIKILSHDALRCIPKESQGFADLCGQELGAYACK